MLESTQRMRSESEDNELHHLLIMEVRTQWSSQLAFKVGIDSQFSTKETGLDHEDFIWPTSFCPGELMSFFGPQEEVS